MTGIAVIAAATALFMLLGPAEKTIPGPPYSHYRDSPSPMRLIQVLSGHPRAERRERVRLALGQASIDYFEQSFTVGKFKGINLIADVGGDEGAPLLIYFSHFDPVPGTPAANDNASCVAAAIPALVRLKRTPPKNLRVRFIFSDGEEYGFVGAGAYRKEYGYENVVGVASFEMCGIGDAIGIWDVTGPAVDSKLVRALRLAADGLDAYHGIHGAVPRFGSDHRAFAGTDVAAVGVTLLPESDEETLRSYVDNPNNPVWALNFMRPIIFRTYHTLEDIAETIDPVAIELTTGLMVDTANILDR